MRHCATAVVPFVAACMLAAAAASASGDADREATRKAMAEIFDSIQVLLPLSVDAERFAAPENREAVRRALATLEARASSVASHAAPRDAGRRHLGESLARDASDALWRYDAGRVESAQFLVRQTTANCVACHTRLRSPSDSLRARRFVSESTLASLPIDERASLLVATRQFDEALAAYEALLADPGRHAAELVSPLTDYLIVSIRVKGDFERPVPTLQRFAARPDLWRRLRLDAQLWLRSLRELREFADKEPRLAEARQLLEAARMLIGFPADRAALVHYVVASSVLHRFLETDSPPTELAEAYYWLGLTESRIGDSYWVSQAEVFLETAVRTAPSGPFAERAYALLEEEVILDYSGSDGAHLPETTRKWLAELRELVDGSAPAEASTDGS